MGETKKTEAAPIVIGRCGDDCQGLLVAEISADGSAWERETCTACKRSWFHDPPSFPAKAYAKAAAWAKATAAPPAKARVYPHERVSDSDLAELLAIEERARVVGLTFDDAMAYQARLAGCARGLLLEVGEARSGAMPDPLPAGGTYDATFHRVQDGYADGWPRAVFVDSDGEPVGVRCGPHEAAAIGAGAKALIEVERLRRSLPANEDVMSLKGLRPDQIQALVRARDEALGWEFVGCAVDIDRDYYWAADGDRVRGLEEAGLFPDRAAAEREITTVIRTPGDTEDCRDLTVVGVYRKGDEWDEGPIPQDKNGAAS